MKFDVSDEDIRKAKHPHEVFLTNLIVNHILLFVGLMGLASTYPLILMVIPAISLVLLVFTLYRAKRSLTTDPWFVKCHWQIGARRSRLFIVMLGLMGVAIILGWLGHNVLGMEKVQVLALSGVAILPTLLTVLVLIIMESDAVHQAANGKLPAWVVERYPNPNVKVIEEE